jgi:hypothetical protein
VAYNYEDSKGWMALGPNISGAAALLHAVKKNAPRKAYPVLHELLTEGSTDSPELLRAEAQRLAEKTRDKDVKDTLLRLARVAAKAKGYLMMTG